MGILAKQQQEHSGKVLKIINKRSSVTLIESPFKIVWLLIKTHFL